MKKFAIVFLIIVAVAIIVYSFIWPTVKNTNTSNLAAPNYQITNHNSITTFMIITSPSFKDGEAIPAKFSCDGGDINPELQIQNVPAEAKSLALIMDDPDATRGRTFTHWLVWNINPKTTLIKEESVPPGSVEGTNDFPRLGYGGPCPPKGSKPHHYHFKLYALRAMLSLNSGASKAQLETEIEKHLVAKTELIGLFQR